MRKSKTVIMYLFIAAVAAGGGYFLSQSRFVPGPAPGTQGHTVGGGTASLLGAERPDFSLPDLEGRRHGPGEWSGKVLVLNFWATWCPPCLKEIPGFVRLQDKYAGRNVQFVGIAVQQPEEVRDFVSSRGINYPILAGEVEVIKVAEKYGNRMGTLPYTVVIDKAQRIAYIRRGPLPESEAERIISPLVAAE